jgi:hypothetical protein
MEIGQSELGKRMGEVDSKEAYMGLNYGCDRRKKK